MRTVISNSDQSEKLRWLKEVIDEGMADVEAGRLMQWDLQEFLRLARAQEIDRKK
jgi:predicted transcriptional regulator